LDSHTILRLKQVLGEKELLTQFIEKNQMIDTPWIIAQGMCNCLSIWGLSGKVRE